MKNFIRPHHQRIAAVLQCFDADYLKQHGILFGGGTRIAMALNEYRESTDIDFFCHSSGAYRAVRSQATQHSLGELIKANYPFHLLREVRADRDAVRTFVKSPIDETAIKLEFIHFDIPINQEQQDGFDIPLVSRESCFTTKLLANADRYMQGVPKDIFDLCMMRKEWGVIPTLSWQLAANCYGEKTIANGLTNALNLFLKNPEKLLNLAIENLKIETELAYKLVHEVAPSFLKEI